MKLLITGGTGFVGTALCKFLDSKNVHYTLVVRPESNTQKLEVAGTNYVVFDGNFEKFTQYLELETFSGVIHLASLYLKDHKPSDLPALINSNVLFSTQMLEATVAAKLPWFINTGSFWQHYQNAHYSPVNLYAATKQAFEDIARFYIETSTTQFVTLKLNDTFGPGDTRPKIFTLWEKIATTGEELQMSGGEQEINLSYIENVTDAYWQLATFLETSPKISGQSFAVSHSEKVTLKELATLYTTVTGKKLNIRWGAVPYRSREVMKPWSKGIQVPGWQPKYTLAEAIKKTYTESL